MYKGKLDYNLRGYLYEFFIAILIFTYEIFFHDQFLAWIDLPFLILFIIDFSIF